MLNIGPKVQNLIIGGIIVRFQPSAGGGYIDLGHIPGNKLSPNVTRGTFDSSRSGVAERVYTYIKERSMVFDCDGVEMQQKTLQYALMADTPVVQAQAAATITSEAFTGKLDRAIRLANRKISALTVTHTSGSPTYTLGTDYDVDLDLGMVRILTGGTPTDGQALKANYTAAVMTALITMNLLQSQRITGSLVLKLVGENSFVGELYFPLVEIQPKGDLSISTDGPMKVAAYTCQVLKSTAAADVGKEWGTFYEIAAAV